jgi:hypothetical protein
MFKNQQKLIAEIHNEFDTAQERLLLEAKEIISGTSKFFSEKAERLEKIGFINSNSVVKHKKNKELLVKNRDQAELIEYYKQNYPFQKFLTEEELNRICKKYGLIYAPVSNYIKEVPEKNLLEIESISYLKHVDLPENLKFCKFNFDNSFFFMPTGSWMSIFCKWRYIIPKEIDGHYRHWSELCRELNSRYNTGIEYLVRKVRNIEINKQGLFIAAPKSHFDLKGLVKEDLLHSTFSIVTVKDDPIVFRYCKGGIQVISKWGLEGKDESLINEKMN